MNCDEKEYFRDATLRICGSLEIENALWQCLLYFKDYFPVDEMSLHIYDRTTGVIGTVATATTEKGIFFRTPQMVKMPKEAKPDQGGIDRIGIPHPDVRIVNRPEIDPVTRQMAKVHGKPDSSILVMRIVIGGERIGALTVRADGLDRYTEEHAKLLSILNEPFGIALSNSLRYHEVLKLKEQLTDDNRYLHRELLQLSGEEIIGSDFGLRGVMEMVRQVAPLSSPVLLLGETGVGKEVIANAIHYSSPRKDNPFIKVNCGAIPDSLLDSELFGHEKGAFTGAIAQKRGRFERADHGTLFLDEVGELPPNAQVRLLRVLQEKEIERVGGTNPTKVDVRVITATNKDLEKMVKSGDFREDLWFRLNVFPVMIPPLRERKEDIPALVYHFIERKSREMGIKNLPTLGPGAMDRLMEYSWPGNIRELQNRVERAMILRKGDVLSFEDTNIATPREVKPDNKKKDKSLTLDEAMARHIEDVLRACGGKVEGKGSAAELLGINSSTLRNRMRKLRIPFGRKKWGKK
ncbi:MAG: AAA family ATPase [Deltaproteobacteria bacterium]|nr:MAG: AAA family ATPase [Deltaproteobacteria bacterium]